MLSMFLYDRDMSIEWGKVVLGVAANLIVPVVLVIIALKLLLRPPLGFLSKFVAEASEEGQSGLLPRTVLCIGLVLIGLFVLCGVFSQLVSLVGMLAISDQAIAEQLRRSLWPRALAVGLQIALGCYLLLGARHLSAYLMGRVVTSSERERPHTTGD